MLTGPHFSADEAGGAGASNVRERLAETRNRIASAAMRYGRNPDSARLIAVSQTQPAANLRRPAPPPPPPSRRPAAPTRALAELGQQDFGENYLQEALPKLTELGDLSLT